jgi:glycine betaine/proline transport system substrate-binding protein
MMISALFKKLLTAMVAMTMVIIGGVSHAADIPENDDPIIIGINEWTGQHITAYVAGHILERMGYNVEYKTAAVFPMATALSDGNITLGLELWDNNMGEYFPGLIEAGKVEDLGAVGIDAREGWLYPKHVEELCPGLPAWDAFLGCADVFSTAETFPDGRFIEYPADWGARATGLIESEGLPFSAIPAGSEGALIAEFKAAVTKNTALVMMFWAPHWLMFEHEAEWVAMPEDLVNKGGMQKPRVLKSGWPGMAEKWPAAYKFIKAYQIDNKVQEELMAQIDRDGRDAVEATKAWVDANEAYWKPFVTAATN